MQEIAGIDLGSIDYQEAWELQEQLLKSQVDLKLAAGKGADPMAIPTQHRLLLVEHPPVYTLGKSGKEENLLLNPSQLDEKGIQYYHINRGGDITYHGPGQLVAYPILDLEKFKRDIGWYLRTLEEIIIEVIASYGLKGDRISGATGVWLDIDTPHARKICAMGVRCSRWITMHGLAFNVNTSLDYFNHIVPCGIDDKGVTSLEKELGKEVAMDEVKSLFITSFGKHFKAKMVKAVLSA